MRRSIAVLLGVLGGMGPLATADFLFFDQPQAVA